MRHNSIFLLLCAFFANGVLAAPNAVGNFRTIQQNKVLLTINPGSDIFAYAVEESLPPGLTPDNINESGFYDEINRKIKWGPFFDTTTRTLLYTVSGEEGEYMMSGSVSFDGVSSTISGDAQLNLSVVSENWAAFRETGLNKVTVLIETGPAVSSLQVVEQIPSGLTPQNISAGGVWQTSDRTVRWGPFSALPAEKLSFDVSGDVGEYQMNGFLFADTQIIAIGGSPILQVTDVFDGPKAIRSISSLTSSYEVSIQVIPGPDTFAFAIEETPPQLATAPTNISNNGFWDSQNKKIKWGPFFDKAPITLSYSIPRSTLTGSFTGTGSFDGVSQGIEGDTSLGLDTVIHTSRNIDGNSVTIAIQPNTSTLAYAVEEALPEGLNPLVMDQDGFWDEVNRKIKWGPFFDSSSRSLSYSVIGAPGSYVLEGNGSFNGVSQSLDGSNLLVINESDFPTVQAQMSGNKLSIEWSRGVLQSATALSGPWTTISSGENRSLLIEINPNIPRQFYRAVNQD